MKLKKNCENCDKKFEYQSTQRSNARFCSRKCLSKLTKKEQDEKRRILWQNETKQEKLDAMQQRLDKFTIKKDDCWEWKGCKDNGGYGVIVHRNISYKAHRASHIVYLGDIPKGLFVLHKCDNRQCTNPKHLFLGNHTDNMRDMARKNRTRVLFGEENKASVLKIGQVKKIKKLIDMGVSCARIAKDFKVTNGTIFSIKHGKTWRNVN